MALELCCSESSGGWAFSPRISFSHDLSQNDRSGDSLNRDDSLILLHSSPNTDFDFCIFEQEPSSSADELFSNGKILPCEIKKPKPPPLPKPISHPDQKKETLKQIMAEEGEQGEEKRVSKSFWRFTRSTSLNCANGSKASLTCSLPGLYRSNSTGTNSNSNSNQNRKRSSSKESKFSLRPFSLSSSLNTKPYSTLPKPPPSKKKNNGGRSSSTTTATAAATTTAKKTHYGYYSNGVRISPVLNVPPPYIAKGTSHLFSLGYFLCRKEKNKRNPFPL